MEAFLPPKKRTMTKETGENQDTLNPDEGASDPDTEEETTEESEETTEETDESEESVEDLKAKLEKQEELAENQKIRAEKAEKELKKKEGKNAPEPPKSGMSSTDLIALVKAKVHPDDVSEVEEYAKFKGISISEALKGSVVKTLLSEKEEERKTANATNIGTKKRGSFKPSGKTILKDAEKGNLPDDPAELVEAREKEREAK